MKLWWREENDCCHILPSPEEFSCCVEIMLLLTLLNGAFDGIGDTLLPGTSVPVFVEMPQPMWTMTKYTCFVTLIGSTFLKTLTVTLWPLGGSSHFVSLSLEYSIILSPLGSSVVPCCTWHLQMSDIIFQKRFCGGFHLIWWVVSVGRDPTRLLLEKPVEVPGCPSSTWVFHLPDQKTARVCTPRKMSENTRRVYVNSERTGTQASIKHGGCTPPWFVLFFFILIFFCHSMELDKIYFIAD